MGNYIDPFDFRTIFVNYFLGNAELFIFAFVIIFSFVAAKFQMSNRIFISLLAIGAIIFSAVLGNAVYILIIFIVGLITFKGIAKIMT